MDGLQSARRAGASQLATPAWGFARLYIRLPRLFLHCKKFGAGNETRTRDPNLGKVVLYQLSYSRINFIRASHPWRYILRFDKHRPRLPLARRSPGNSFMDEFLFRLTQLSYSRIKLKYIPNLNLIARPTLVTKFSHPGLTK